MGKILTGKVALVTGRSCGIGAATACALAEEGADAAVSYTDTASTKAEGIVRELREKGVRATAYQADQADPVQVTQLIEQVVEHFGHLDILINNAGILVFGKVHDPERDEARFARLMAINLAGVATAVRAATRIIGEGGRIISVGSSFASWVGTTGWLTRVSPRLPSRSIRGVGRGIPDHEGLPSISYTPARSMPT